jgi:hypothetical protein
MHSSTVILQTPMLTNDLNATTVADYLDKVLVGNVPTSETMFEDFFDTAGRPQGWEEIEASLDAAGLLDEDEGEEEGTEYIMDAVYTHFNI